MEDLCSGLFQEEGKERGNGNVFIEYIYIYLCSTATTRSDWFMLEL